MDLKAVISKHTTQANNAAMKGLKQVDDLLQPQHLTATTEAKINPNPMHISFSDQPDPWVTYDVDPRIPLVATHNAPAQFIVVSPMEANIVSLPWEPAPKQAALYDGSALWTLEHIAALNSLTAIPEAPAFNTCSKRSAKMVTKEKQI